MAETTIEPGRRGDKLRGPDAKPAKLRLVIRRSRLLGAQGELWPNWRYHCFVTDRHDLDTVAADANHRGHATVELAIRDLKEGSGLSRCPSSTIPRQRRLARLLRARAQPRPLDRPPRKGLLTWENAVNDNGHSGHALPVRSVAGGIDGIGAVFDDGSLVADGGLLLAGTVMSRLGLEALCVRAGRRARARGRRC